jgi:hypothetical protein
MEQPFEETHDFIIDLLGELSALVPISRSAHNKHSNFVVENFHRFQEKSLLFWSLF